MHRKSDYDLKKILSNPESESLDRKEKFHKDNIDLIHDILCLANSYADSDRYLIFGQDNNFNICGIEKDSGFKTNANIQDLLRNSKFNRIPTINLQRHEIDNKHEIGVLIIKNRPDKPFYLTEDKVDGKKRIRNGVIYTRIGDTNIPLNESAPEEKIELMWRERFGFILAPLARFNKLLRETRSWVKLEGDLYIYHREFPEFSIRNGEIGFDNFEGEWLNGFSDKRAKSYDVELWYQSIILDKLVFISCDGGRYQIPLPDGIEPGKRSINKNSNGFLIAKLYSQHSSLEQALKRCGIKLVDQ